MAFIARPGLAAQHPRANSALSRRAARPAYQSFSEEPNGTAATTTSVSSKVKPNSDSGGTARPL